MIDGNPIIEQVRAYVEPVLDSYGLILHDVQFRRETNGWVLRVVIDREAGVTLEDCSRVSREISDFLDVEDVIEHQYQLEISSPGAERELRSPSECLRFVGAMVRLKLHHDHEGRKVFVGTLTAVEDEIITVDTREGGVLRMQFNDINKIRLTLET
jgi:ribosome maturation factor RimP